MAESGLNVLTIGGYRDRIYLPQPMGDQLEMCRPMRELGAVVRAGSTFKLLTTRQAVTREVLIQMLSFYVTNMFVDPR